MDAWGGHQSVENSEKVMAEIPEGDCYLLIPSINDSPQTGTWKTVAVGTTVKFTCVFNPDGLKSLDASTDKNVAYMDKKIKSIYVHA